MSRQLFLGLCLSLSLISTKLLSQSPWVQEKSEGFAQLGGTLIGPYQELIQSGGDETFKTSRELTDLSLQAYLAYGLGKGWDVSFVIPMAFLSSGSLNPDASLGPTTSEGNLSALGNIQLGLKKKLLDGPVILSAYVRTGLNTSSYDESTGLRSGYDAFDLAPGLSLGKGYERGYFFVGTGPTFRSGGYSSEWRLEAEAGYQIFPGSYLMLNIFVIESLRDGDIALPQANLETGLFVNNQSFFAFGPKLLLAVHEHFGFSAALYGAAGGNQVAYAPSINFGLYGKF